MIVISDLSPSNMQVVSAAEMSAVVGGFGYWGGYSYKKAKVNVTQVAIAGGFLSPATNISGVFISQ
jgi:hypothetical protein